MRSEYNKAALSEAVIEEWFGNAKWRLSGMLKEWCLRADAALRG
jgi:hypothetical protein